MKIFSLRILVMMCFFSTGTSVEAGIYLLYDEAKGTPAAILDDANDDFQDDYISSRAHMWSRTNPAPRLPLAFNPALSVVSGNSMTIPSVILFSPTATRSPELSHVLQGSHAWSSYQTGNNATGVGLVYSPSYGANLSPTQKSARGNRARAQAFRLDYYR